MTIDIDALNTEAKALYDLAFDRGRQEGDREGGTRAARNAAENMLTMTDALLRNAIGVPEHRTTFTALARMALGKVPLLVSDPTHAAIDAVGRHRTPDVVDPAELQQAQEHVAVALARLKDMR